MKAVIIFENMSKVQQTKWNIKSTRKYLLFKDIKQTEKI